MVWTIQRLHKFLYGCKFKLITDHNALRHIFDPKASLSKCTNMMLARWAIILSGYDYEIEFKPEKLIPNAYYFSRHSCQLEAESVCLFVNPLPVTRNELFMETKLAYASLLSAMKNGWSQIARRQHPKLYAKRKDITLTPDGLLLVNKNH